MNKLTSAIRSYFSTRLWLAALLVIFVAATWHNFNNKLWLKDEGVVKHDIISYYSYLPAAIIHNDLSFSFIEDDPEFFAGKLYVHHLPDSGIYIKMTMGLSLMYAPFFMAGHITASLTGAEMNGFSTPYMFFLQFSSLFYLLLGLLLLRKILARHFPDWIVASVLLAVVAGTNLFFYTTMEAAMPHSYNFFLFSLFVWLTIRWYENRHIKYALALGLIIGLITLIRPSNALIALFFIFYDVKSLREFRQRPGFYLHHWRQTALIVLMAFLVMIPQFVFWKLNTGSWFFYSYSDEGFFFSNPQILNGLFSYRKGWLIYTPLMVLALVGFIPLYKQMRQYFAAILIFSVFNVYLIFSWWCWWYGGSFGARPMIDSYPLLAIPLAAFIMWVSQTQRQKKIILAVLFMLTGLSSFQTLQYQKHMIHFDAMTSEAYWSSFASVRRAFDFFDMLEHPDYEAAKRGKATLELRSKSIIYGSMQCGYETLTPDGRHFFSTDTRFLLEGTATQTRNKSRSGQYSIVLTTENPYSSNFSFRTRVAEEYIVSVWKYPAQSEARLVFTSKFEKDHYQAEARVVEVDAEGWGRIEANFIIPENLGELFRIYIWNPSQDSVWFDDLSIINRTRLQSARR